MLPRLGGIFARLFRRRRVDPDDDPVMLADYHRAPDDRARLALCERLARQGNAHALFRAAGLYLYGDGAGLYQPERAVDYYRKAAQRNHVEAQRSLAYCYRWGRGTAKNADEAAHWFLAAARHGHPWAAREIAECYAQGWGVPRDGAAAQHWYEEAVKQDNIQACYELGLLYAGSDVDFPRDPDRALMLMSRAAEKNHGGAYCTMGHWASKGRILPQDEAAAVRWWQQALACSWSEAIMPLSLAFLYGRGVPPDAMQALTLLLLALTWDQDSAANILKILDRSVRDSLLDQASHQAAMLYREYWDPDSDLNDKQAEILKILNQLDAASA